MSAVIAQLAVSLSMDIAKAQKEIEKGLTEGASAGMKSAQKEISKGFGGVIKDLTVPAAAAFGAVSLGAGKAIGAASDLGESANAVNKVFGDASDTIHEFGKNSAQSIGLSNNSWNTMAAQTGAMLQNMGYDADEAAQKTQELGVRAADMASIFNTDVEQAMSAMQAALRGEFDPLEQFGVKLSASAVEAEGMALGLTTVVEKNGKMVEVFDKSQSAIAVNSLLMKQTANYAGDFADTNDSLANSQKILAAEVEDTAAKLADSLLPIAEQVVEILRNMVNWVGENTTLVTVLAGVIGALSGAILIARGAMSAWETASKVFSGVQGLMQSEIFKTIGANVKLAASAALEAGKTAAAWVMAQVKVVASLGKQAAAMVIYQAKTLIIKGATMAWTAGQWLLNAALAANPIGLVIALIVALVAAIVIAWQKSETFRNIVTGVWEAIKSVVATVVDWFMTHVWPTLQKVWDGIAKGVEILVGLVKGYIDTWIAIFKAGMELIKKVAETVWNAISTVVETVLSFIKAYISTWINVVKGIWEGIKALWNKAVEIFDAIKSKIQSVLDAIRNFISTWIDRVMAVWNKIIEIKDSVVKAFTGAFNAVKEWCGKIIDWVKNAVGDIVDAFKSIISDMVNVGKDIVNGLWNGIKSMWNTLKNNVANFISDAIPGAVKKLLGISSPSKVFAEIGTDVVLGLQQGITKSKPDLWSDFENLIPPSVAGSWQLVTPDFPHPPGVGAGPGSGFGPGSFGGMNVPIVQVFIGDEQLDSRLVKVIRKDAGESGLRLMAGSVV